MMFNKFSNPDNFMGKNNYISEAAVAPPPSTPPSSPPSTANGTSSSVSNKPSVPSINPTPKPSNSTPPPVSNNHSPKKIGNPPSAGFGKCKGGVCEDYGSYISRKDTLNKVIMEYMDMKDPTTITQVTSLNEAEQNTFLISLTTRLYSLIVGKIDDIDFGDIPNTKGDVRKLSKYKQIRECIELLHDIFVQYKENPEPVNVIDNALSNLENNSHLFISGYASNIDMVKMVYETTTLGVINALGFMIAVCIEYVKTPKKEGLTITLSKTGVRKVKDHLMYENLIKFNEACKSGDLNKGLEPLVKEKVKDLATLTGLFYGARIILAIGVVVAAIIPFLKQMVYFFYASRVRMSTYLDAQADLLEMNANELNSNNSIQTVDDKKRVIARQLKIAKLFHDTANKIAIEDRDAENQATRDLKEDTKKFKMDEVNSNPANTVADGPLF